MIEYQDFLSLFQGVKMRGSHRAMCRCPCHDDKKASLSIDKIDDRILLHCFAGCTPEKILAEVGLSFRDLYDPAAQKINYIEKLEQNHKKRISAIYKYTDENGKYLYEKIRFHDKNMLIGIYNQDSNSLLYGLHGQPKTLFHLPQLISAISEGKQIFYVEGEKDVLMLENMGFCATTAGGANDWKKEYTSYFENADIVILPDNDSPGKGLANKIYQDLQHIAKSVQIVKTSQIPKGDVTDYIEEGHTKEDLLKLINSASIPPQKSLQKKGNSLEMTSMADATEKTPEWLVPGYIPKNSITIIAGDGGSGKTTVWCEIAASISSNRPCFLIQNTFPEIKQSLENGRILFFSAEDTFETTLLRRLKKNGANLENIFSINISDDRFPLIRFDSNLLEDLVDKYRPVLLIFDPIQAFVPPHIKMSDRNAIRNCMRHLIALGEKYNCTSLVIVHSNKQSGLWGRKRMADSADIWDISRSVLMIGETKDNSIRYISHEKSNYSATSDTILFSIENEKIIFRNNTDKKDRDFVTEVNYSVRQAPKREAAKEFILNFIKEEETAVSELDEMAEVLGFSSKTLRLAKEDLKKNKIINIYPKGFNPKKWYVSLMPPKNKD